MLLLAHYNGHLTDLRMNFYKCTRCFSKITSKSLQEHFTNHVQGLIPAVINHIATLLTPKQNSTETKVNSALEALKTVSSSVCKICGMTLNSEGKITKHKAIHSGITPYMCGTCGVGYSRDHLLLKHADVHDESDWVAFKCGICLMSTNEVIMLKRHLATSHNIQ